MEPLGHRGRSWGHYRGPCRAKMDEWQSRDNLNLQLGRAKEGTASPQAGTGNTISKPLGALQASFRFMQHTPLGQMIGKFMFGNTGRDQVSDHAHGQRHVHMFACGASFVVSRMHEYALSYGAHLHHPHQQCRFELQVTDTSSPAISTSSWILLGLP